jgi:aspartate/methionine/tyrosine aminotransferase
MTALVIKNLPDDVLTRLKERAKANHRSLTKEAIVLLAHGVGQAPPPPRARDDFEDAVHARADDPGPAPDGREALRAALVKQPDGSYINVLGIDDESFFKTLESVRSEIRFPETPDFGDESH